MMNQAKHAYVLIGIVAAGTVLFLTGSPGGLLFWLWPLSCLAMMSWLMWSMRDTGRSAADPADHIHEDGWTHAHR